MYRKAYFIGIIAYLAMLAFALLFYKERIIFLDTAFSMFHIAKDSTFCIQIFRFGNVMNQAWPVLAAKAGLSLSTMAMLFSAGFVVYYFVCYLVAGLIFRRYDLALVILMLHMLFAAHTFYWAPSELPQGIAILFILYAVLSTKSFADVSPIQWGLLIATVITIAFFHPLLIFIIVYCTLYFAQEEDLFKDRRLLWGVAIAYISVVIIKAIAFRTPYEQHSLSGMKNFVTQFPDYFTLYSNRLFLHRIITLYYWIPVLFVYICSMYARAKQWHKLLLFAVSCLGYFFLVNISYPNADTPEFYRENLYTPLTVFMGLPFVFDVLPVLAQRRIAMPVFCLVLITGCIRLYATHDIYTARLDHERKILDTYANQKIILQSRQADTDSLLMLWGTPYEIWLLSTIERGKTASIIIDDDPPHRDWAKHHTKDFIVNWDFFAYKDLPPQYFHLTDTVTGYTIDSSHIN